MSENYIPPFKITPAIISLVAAISQMIGRPSVLEEASKIIRLRRINRILTIQGSLAIEGSRHHADWLGGICLECMRGDNHKPGATGQ
jgi:Fic family protein